MSDLILIKDITITTRHITSVGEFVDERSRGVCINLSDRTQVCIMIVNPKYDETKLAHIVRKAIIDESPITIIDPEWMNNATACIVRF